jgi:SAM-dependent methyltransferase
MTEAPQTSTPALLLLDYEQLFTREDLPGPILDLACGDGRNGIFLASRSLPVILADRSESALEDARGLARQAGVEVEIWPVDLEGMEGDPLQGRSFGAILVFRYLHRPLLPTIRRALSPGGLLVYETFTSEQQRFGKPRNPEFLLRPGELLKWFGDWERVHYFEGIQTDPPRAVAQLIARKPMVSKPEGNDIR